MPTPRPQSTTIAAMRPTNGSAIPNRFPILCARLNVDTVAGVSGSGGAQDPARRRDRRDHFDLAAREANVLEHRDRPQESKRPPVLADDRRAQALDARRARVGDERAHERLADAAALVLVDDRDRDLGDR